MTAAPAAAPATTDVDADAADTDPDPEPDDVVDSIADAPITLLDEAGWVGASALRPAMASVAARGRQLLELALRAAERDRVGCDLCPAPRSPLNVVFGEARTVVCTACLRKVLGLASPPHWPVPRGVLAPADATTLARAHFQPALAVQLAAAAALCYRPESELAAAEATGARCGSLTLLQLMPGPAGAFAFLAVDDTYLGPVALAGGRVGALVLCFRGTVTMHNIATGTRRFPPCRAAPR